MARRRRREWQWMIVCGIGLFSAAACGDGEDGPGAPPAEEGGSPSAETGGRSAEGGSTAEGGGPVEGGDTSVGGQGGQTEVPDPSGGSGAEITGGAGAGESSTGGVTSPRDIPRCDPDTGRPSTIPDAPTSAAYTERTCDPAEGELPALRSVTVVDGLDDPVDIKSPPGDTSRLFIVQRPGSIAVVKDGVVLDAPFLEVEVDSGYVEDGLLGLAFHPNYEENGLFYIHYVGPRGEAGEAGHVVLAEYEVDPDDPDRALTTPRRILMDLEQATHKHKGGSLEFDDEGRLLISLGNAGITTNSGTPGEIRGKVLRILPAIDGDGYEIPEDNPQLDGWAPEVLEMGLRNPWRIALDHCTSDLFIGDVGSEVYEEINYAPGGEHGHDYGFPGLEGDDCHPSWGDTCEPEGKTNPLAKYSHAEGCAVTGGRVYRGHAIPALRGTYFYADVCTGRFYKLVPEDGSFTSVEVTDELNECGVKGISSFGEDSAGELYFLSRNTGGVYRIEAL